jgi:hypothetical protein
VDGLPTWVRWIIVGAVGLCPIHLEEPPRAGIRFLRTWCLVTLMFNYHDLGHLGVDRAAMNRAVFRALKPGGFTSSPIMRAGRVLAYPNPGPCIGSKKPFLATKSKQRASGWWRKESSCGILMIQGIRTRRTRHSRRMNSC